MTATLYRSSKYFDGRGALGDVSHLDDLRRLLEANPPAGGWGNVLVGDEATLVSLGAYQSGAGGLVVDVDGWYVGCEIEDYAIFA